MTDLYQQFIHKSRYSRYLPEKKRRENLQETVDRYCDFMKTHLKEFCDFEDEKLFKKLNLAIFEMRDMPSMRAVMTAGKALDRDNTAGYNCSYLPIDDIKSFDEAMYILMCGVGVGFSVERQYVNQLPEIPELIFASDITIVVKDSKEGWAKALRQLISLLYAGELPKTDTSRLRPAGAKLKTFGGTSSGPGPLEELFRFVVKTFQNAKGRRLTSIECHDIMCKIGDTVVSGGVRRSALLSLSNLSDERMRSAKSGAWWESQSQRALANNSAVYTERPDIGMFMKEWISLYESKSGERGIFNREASIIQAMKNGRRDGNHIWGTNPCSEIILRPYQFCNLSEVIARSDDTFESLKEKVRIATILGTIQSTLTNFPYLRKIWQKNTEEERLLGVSITGIFDCPLLNNIFDEDLSARLEELRFIAVDTNKKYAKLFGIPQSTAITCVKPSGTVSSLTNTASGIHPRHAQYNIRRVRNDNMNPLTKFMIDSGVPSEPDVMKNTVTVFSFPQKAPEGAILRDDVSTIDHLNLWLIYQRHWCEHKPSVTISVKENEWMEVGAWVWKHFDECTGISFLPWDGGTYQQAPFEEITKERYEELIALMPKTVNWDDLVEQEDNVEGVQMLACVAGCEV